MPVSIQAAVGAESVRAELPSVARMDTHGWLIACPVPKNEYTCSDNGVEQLQKDNGHVSFTGTSSLVSNDSILAPQPRSMQSIVSYLPRKGWLKLSMLISPTG